MEYSNTAFKILDFLLSNDNDKIDLLMRDHSKKKVIFAILMIKYTSIFIILSLFPILVFGRDIVLDLISYGFYQVLFEVSRILSILIITLSLSVYYATIKIIDDRYKRYDINGLFSEGEKYPFIYGKYLHLLKKLRRNLILPSLIYILFFILTIAFFYFMKLNINDNIYASLVTIIFACISTGYFLTTRKYFEFSGRANFLGYINNESELSGLRVKHWGKILIFIDDPYYYFIDQKKNKYMKFEILSNQLFDRMDKIYEKYLDEKIILVKEFLNKEKEDLCIEKKGLPTNSARYNEINFRLKEIDERQKKLNTLI